MKLSSLSAHIIKISIAVLKNKASLVIGIIAFLATVIPVALKMYDVDISKNFAKEDIFLYTKFVFGFVLLWIVSVIIFKLYKDYEKLFNQQNNIDHISTKLVGAIEDGRLDKTQKYGDQMNTYIDSSTKGNLLSDILKSFSGEILFKTKKDFNYDITLENCSNEKYKENYFRAFFHIQFSVFVTSPEVILDVAVTDNEFHDIYRELHRKDKGIYRYILKSAEPLLITDEVFKITSIKVNNEFELEQNSTINEESGYMEIVCRDGKGRLEKLNSEMVKFDIRIETLVDKRQNEFPIIFGYPVKNLDTSLTYAKTDIEAVDVIDMITATTGLVKSPLKGRDLYGAKTKLNGWMVPYSGVIYTWKQSSQFQK